MTQKNIYFCFLFLLNASVGYKFDTKWFEVPLDHFNFQINETFQIKYLENNDHWNRSGGPIFFYMGYENIDGYINSPGFVREIAPAFQAKIVFVQHRFYGDSIPFNDTALATEHIGYLSVAQALSDFAALVNSMGGGTKYPVIAFGVSYTGMLSAYMRMRYPHLVAGAIASSAPVHIFPGVTPCDTYYRGVTSSFKLANANCSKNIRNSWDVLRNFTKDANNYDWLKTNWRLCDPVQSVADIDQLESFLKNMYTEMAMYNTPYPTGDQPANPVKTVCEYLSEELSGKPLLEAISKVLDVHSNFNKSVCVDYLYKPRFSVEFETYIRYMACTEMPQTMCTTGVEDMFREKPYNRQEYSEQCYDAFGVYPTYEWAEVEFGGDRLQAASNIVFSNGLLDPWAGCGVLHNISETVKAFVIKDSSHGMDLYASNAADPQSVKEARAFHKQNIKEWIRNFKPV